MLPFPMGEEAAEEAALFAELLMMLRGAVPSRLHLPASSSFSALASQPSNEMYVHDVRFATHHTYNLPLDSVPLGEPTATLVHVIHRFAVQPRLCVPLNAELTAYATHGEAEFRERQRAWKARCDADPELAETEARQRWRKPSGEDLTVQLSNRGGWQSQHTMFQDDACKPCLDLRAIVILI